MKNKFMEARNAWERAFIVEQLKAHNGNVSVTARDLGMASQSLHVIMGRLQIKCTVTVVFEGES